MLAGEHVMNVVELLCVYNLHARYPSHKHMRDIPAISIKRSQPWGVE